MGVQFIDCVVSPDAKLSRSELLHNIGIFGANGLTIDSVTRIYIT